jgi:DNA-binding MarR family transcriptional regulator
MGLERIQNNKIICDDVLISLRKIIQSIDLHSRALVKQVGLTGPQLIVLWEISKSGEISIGKIARAVSLGQATVTGIIDRLEKRSLVFRQRSQTDRRQMILKLTDTGATLLAKAPPIMQESFIESFSQLQDWEQTMILSSLQRIVSMLDAKEIKAAPILATESISESAGPPSMNPSPLMSKPVESKSDIDADKKLRIADK